MPILTESDKPIYFPDITLTGDALVGAILRAQSLAESNMGCDRPLEKTSFKEVCRVHSNRIARLTHAPIIDETSDFHIDARDGGYKDGFGRIIPMRAWFPLVESDYALDANTGEISLGLHLSEIRATYASGFDFSLDTPDVRRIKSAVAAILNYQQSNAYQGLQEISVEGEYKLRYGSSNGGVGTIPDVLLIPFRKYRPRSFC